MEPLISVIVPVYNVEDYLDRCVDSIVNQTYNNLEIILVDDGSTDSSGKKCDEWLNKDSRIRVIHKENGGLSDARNAGLDVALGEYIGFVDSDDYIDTKMYQKLFDVLVKTNADVVECRWKSFSEESEFSENQKIDEEDVSVFLTEEALRELIQENRLKQTVVNKLYKRDVITELFPKGKINEDDFWTYKVFGNSKKVTFADCILYYYFQRSTSIMHVKYSVKRLDGVLARKERMEYIQKRFPNIYNYACLSYLWACFYHCQVICRNTEIDEKGVYRTKLIDEYRNYYSKDVINLKTLKQRVWMNCFRLFPGLTCRVRNLLKIGL